MAHITDASLIDDGPHAASPASGSDRRVSVPLESRLFGLSQSVRSGFFFAQAILAARMAKPKPLPDQLRARMPSNQTVLKHLRRVHRRDRRNVTDGLYQLPHTAFDSPLSALRMAGRFLREVPVVDRRRHAEHGNREVFEATQPDGAKAEDGGFPRYYRQNFHYQTDGYLSEHSARLYDHQVEVLFYGGADAMRRQCLVPLARFLRSEAAAGRGIASQKLLDVACGTGRFLSFVKDNYPRLPVTALDLSPYYVEEARWRLSPWSRTRFEQGDAANMPCANGSADIVTCIYLFHELPERVRDEVVREIARVLRPGGICIFMDALQFGDEPELDPLLESFPILFYEPYFLNYCGDDLQRRFTAAGLETLSIDTVFFSRMMTLRKPLS